MPDFENVNPMSRKVLYTNYPVFENLPYGLNICLGPIGNINFGNCAHVYACYPGNDTTKPPLLYNLVNQQGVHYRTVMAEHVLILAPVMHAPTTEPPINYDNIVIQ